MISISDLWGSFPKTSHIGPFKILGNMTVSSPESTDNMKVFWNVSFGLHIAYMLRLFSLPEDEAGSFFGFPISHFKNCCRAFSNLTHTTYLFESDQLELIDCPGHQIVLDRRRGTTCIVKKAQFSRRLAPALEKPRCLAVLSPLWHAKSAQRGTGPM